MLDNPPTDFASKLVGLLSKDMSYPPTTNILRVQMFFSYMCLHKFGAMDRKGAWNAWFERRQLRINRNGQMVFSICDTAQAQALITLITADQPPCAT